MRTPKLTKALAALLLMSAAATSQAAVLLVTTAVDSYDGVCNLHCSLRDAVAHANQTAEADVILLRSDTYVLSLLNPRDDENSPFDEDDNLLGDLDVKGDLVIQGAGIGKTIITGTDSHLFAVEHRLFEAHPGANLVLRQLTLTDGRSGENGGAVENHGRLLLQSVRALRNITRETIYSGGGYGGAIANYGELLVLDAQFDDNTAIKEEDTPLGGAIYNNGRLGVRGSHFFGNEVGGLPLDGAGSAIYSDSVARIENSSFVRNTAPEFADGGVIANDHGGELTLTNSTLSDNYAIVLSNRSSSKALLTNVTIADNILELDKQAVMNEGQLRIRNSLIAGNYENWSEPPFAANCRNLGAGFSYQAIGLLRNDEQSNCAADLFVPFEQTFSQVLSPDLDSDGKTFFHALLPGGPAVDAGVGDCIAQDQRKTARPQDGNGDDVAICDLGAYELTP